MTVKRYRSDKAPTGDSCRREAVTFEAANPDFNSIVLTGADVGELEGIAELLEVLGGAASGEKG